MPAARSRNSNAPVPSVTSSFETPLPLSRTETSLRGDPLLLVTRPAMLAVAAGGLANEPSSGGGGGGSGSRWTCTSSGGGGGGDACCAGGGLAQPASVALANTAARLSRPARAGRGELAGTVAAQNGHTTSRT